MPRLYIFMLLLLKGFRLTRPFVLSTKSSLSLDSIRSMTTRADDLLGHQLEVPLQDALACHGDENVSFFDGSWWLGQPDKAREAYERGPRIAGAHFYDIDDVASKTPDLNPKGLPHMMPPPALQAAYMDTCQVTNQHHVIIYGQENCPFVHRAWYQMVAMGHDVAKTHLLAGSLQDWMDVGGPVDTETTQVQKVDELPVSKKSSYQAVAPGNRVVTMEQMRQIINDPNVQIVDARSSERFLAQVDEPRPGLRRGHMPGAKNIFFQDVLKPDSPVQLRDTSALTDITKDLLDPQKRIVASCGSGATGCTVLAALVKAGYDPDKLALYDGKSLTKDHSLLTENGWTNCLYFFSSLLPFCYIGSWMEWGADSDAPIVDERKRQDG